MIELLALIILTVLVTNGIWTVTSKGYFLEFVSKWYESLYFKEDAYYHTKSIKPERYYLNKALIIGLKPVIGCITCMASFWSLVMWLQFYPFSLSGWAIVALSVSFINHKLNTTND